MPTSPHRIRVLVAEDSVTARELLVSILSSDPAIEVVGEARNGVEAVEMTRSLRPNVVTMDIHMPRMSGFEATKTIMREIPTPVVIVSGSVDPNEVATSMQALQVGALTVLPKPKGPDAPGFETTARVLLQTVKAMAGVKVVRHWPPRVMPPGRPARREGLAPVRLLALAASTGGPAALQRILADLPPRLPVPILIVQHMAPGFVAGFVRWLDTVSLLHVRIATEGQRLEPSTVYLAPEDHHLGVDRQGRATVSNAPPIEGFRPSASFLFASAAAAYGPSVLAVVLTGMGSDGLDGLRAVRAAHGQIIAQDKASSVVFGMPGAAVAAGLADDVVSVTQMAGEIEERVGDRANEG